MWKLPTCQHSSIEAMEEPHKHSGTSLLQRMVKRCEGGGAYEGRGLRATEGRSLRACGCSCVTGIESQSRRQIRLEKLLACVVFQLLRVQPGPDQSVFSEGWVRGGATPHKQEAVGMFRVNATNPP